jgi:hypothetical protein
MRIMRHLGPTLLCAWVLWSMAESSGPSGPISVPWRIQAAYPVYTACVQAARSAAIEEQAVMSKAGDAAWGPVRDERSGQFAAWVKKLKTGDTVRSDFRCFPDTIKKP